MVPGLMARAATSPCQLEAREFGQQRQGGSEAASRWRAAWRRVWSRHDIDQGAAYVSGRWSCPYDASEPKPLETSLQTCAAVLNEGRGAWGRPFKSTRGAVAPNFYGCSLSISTLAWDEPKAGQDPPTANKRSP